MGANFKMFYKQHFDIIDYIILYFIISIINCILNLFLNVYVCDIVIKFKTNFPVFVGAVQTFQSPTLPFRLLS